MKRILRFVLLAVVAAACTQAVHAQTSTIEKCKQNSCYGYGAPSGACVGAFIYSDISTTPVQAYSCKNFVWAAQASSYTLPAQYKTWSCHIDAGDGANAITAATYLRTSCRNDTGATLTITGIRCVADAGASTCNATNGAGTGLLTGAVTGTSTYASGTQSATVTIAAGDYLKITIIADGTSKQVGIDVAATY